jgi:hypothetical protein
MNLLSRGASVMGKDELAEEVIRNGRSMAEDLNLLSIAPTPSVTTAFCQMRPETIKATAHVAWGSYCWFR